MPLMPKRRVQPMPANDTEALFDGPGLPSEALFVDPLPAGGVLNADVEEARGSDDDHFYGAWMQGGGRGAPMSRAQVASAPAFSRPMIDGSARSWKSTKYNDLDEAEAWLHSKGVNKPFMDQAPVELVVPQDWERLSADGDFVLEGQTLAVATTTTEAITAPFTGRIRKIDGGFRVSPEVPAAWQALGSHYGLEQLTPELRGRLVRALERLDAKYPGVMGNHSGLTTVAVSGGPIFGGTKKTIGTMGLGTMTFNPAYMIGPDAERKLDTYASFGHSTNWAFGDTFETAYVNHEFGHAVDQYLRFDRTGQSPYSFHYDRHRPAIPAPAPPDFRAMTTQQTKWYGEDGMTMDMLYSQFRDRKARGSTGYSYTNHEERFAESFSRLQVMTDQTLPLGRQKPLQPWERELRKWLNTVPGWKT